MSNKKIFKCKYCNEEFPMFVKEDGELVSFVEKYPWPIHGSFVLTDHFRNKHKNVYECAKIFFPAVSDSIAYMYNAV